MTVGDNCTSSSQCGLLSNLTECNPVTQQCDCIEGFITSDTASACEHRKFMVSLLQTNIEKCKTVDNKLLICLCLCVVCEINTVVPLVYVSVCYSFHTFTLQGKTR